MSRRRLQVRPPVDQHSERSDLMRILFHAALADGYSRHQRYPEGIFGRGIFGVGRYMTTVWR